MTTTTSYSNKDRFFGLYKSTLKRSAGYFGMFSALIFVFYPLQYILEIMQGRSDLAVTAAAGRSLSDFVTLGGFAENFTGASMLFFTLLMALAPMIFALLLNSYMQSHKAADVYHALPLTRGMLLTANAAAAMTMIALPVIVSDIIIAAVQIVNFGFSAWMIAALAVDTIGWLIMALVVYALVTVVSIGTGTTFDTLIHSLALIFALPTLIGMFLLLAEQYLNGWIVDEMVMFDTFLFSPVMVMAARMAISDGSGDMYSRMISHSNVAIVVYLILGVALLALGVWLYRRRHSEMAETTNSKGPLKIAVKFIGVLVCGVLSGVLFGHMMGGQTGYIVWSIIGGMLTYAILEAILNRGFKTMIKSLPLGVLMAAVCVGSGVVLMNGGLGYETRVPSTNDVESVEVGYTGRFNSEIRIINRQMDDDNPVRLDSVILSEPADIQAVTEFHRAAIAYNIEMKRRMEERESFVFYRDTSIPITYRLKNGGKISRRYSVNAAAAEKLAPLEVSPEFLQQTHPAYFTKGDQIKEWEFSNVYGTKDVKQSLSAAESGELLAAISSDISAQTLEELKNPKPGIYAVVTFYTNLDEKFRNNYYNVSLERHNNALLTGERSAYFGRFPVSDTSQNTYKWLAAKGILTELEVSLDDCMGVSAVATADMYNGRRGGSLVTESRSYGDGRADSVIQGTLEEAKREISAEKKRRAALSNEYGAETLYFAGDVEKQQRNDSVAAVFEAPGEIKALSGAIVHTASAGRSYIVARFYFKNSSGNTVLLDPQLLPQNILDKFTVIEYKNG